MNGPNLQELLDRMMDPVGGNLVNLLIAVAILIVGWLAALIVAGVARGLMRRLKLDDRLGGLLGRDPSAPSMSMTSWIGTGVFYLIMLFVLVAFFQALKLTMVTTPLLGLLEEVFQFLPRILGAALIFLLAWIVGSVVKFLVLRGTRSVGLDERFGNVAGQQGQSLSVSASLANAAFWLIILIFLPAVLDALQMQGMLTPVQEMFEEVLGIVPNMVGAGLILLVGWFIARIVRQVTTNLLSAAGADRLGEKAGLGGHSNPRRLSVLVGTIAYILILLPSVIAALNALEISAISEPATAMLETFLNALPSVFAAAILLALGYIVARLLSGVVTSLLAGIGFNQLPVKLGLQKAPAEGQRTPAEIAGWVVMVTLILFASIEAADLLQFSELSDMLAEFVTFGGHMLLAIVILGIGLYLSNLAHSLVISTGGSNAAFGATLTRVAILILVSAMALRQMGIANEIVNMAFGLMLGAVALAAGLAFGLGSREVAGREVSSWLESIRGRRL